MHNDDENGVPALINAIWALGLISERIELKEYIIDLSKVILDLFTQTPEVANDSVMENLAITIGRMAMTHPEVFSTGAFASDLTWARWCDSISKLDILEEKSSAFMGFIRIVNLCGDSIPVTPKTIGKIVKGLSNNVDASPFSQEVLSFLMKYQSVIQTLTLSPEEVKFLQHFTS